MCAALAITSSFGRLATLATVSILAVYLLCCIAAWILRRRDVRAEGAVPFTVPGGPIVPVLAVAVIVWLLSSATLREFAIVGAVARWRRAALRGLTRAARNAHRDRMTDKLLDLPRRVPHPREHDVPRVELARRDAARRPGAAGGVRR